MDLRTSEEQDQIRDSARKFLENECPIAHVRAMAAGEKGYSRDLWRGMAELGWIALALPEEHGGIGLSFLDLAVLLEELGRALVPSPFVPTVVLAAQAISRYGDEEQRAEHLPPLLAGDRIVAVARTGSGANWDPSDVSVSAEQRGDDWVLDGAATLVDYAHAADLLLVVARCESGAACFLVPTSADGIEIEGLQTVGHDHRSRLVLSSVRVPGGGLLGGTARGAEIARDLARWGAVARCADMLGAGQRVLDMTVAYAGERVAFGKPIGAFQAVQHHCANMAVDVLTSRFVTYEAAWRLTVRGGADKSVSVAKAWVSDAMARVCALGHQVHGAIGFTEEHDLHLFSRRIRSAGLDFGDAFHHRRNVADTLGLLASDRGPAREARPLTIS